MTCRYGSFIQKKDCSYCLSSLENTKVCVFMNTQISFPPVKSRQLFVKVFVAWFIRPMSCVLEATAGRLLKALGCLGKEQGDNHKNTKEKNASTSQLSILI